MNESERERWAAPLKTRLLAGARWQSHSFTTWRSRSTGIALQENGQAGFDVGFSFHGHTPTDKCDID